MIRCLNARQEAGQLNVLRGLFAQFALDLFQSLEDQQDGQTVNDGLMTPESGRQGIRRSGCRDCGCLWLLLGWCHYSRIPWIQYHRSRAGSRRNERPVAQP